MNIEENNKKLYKDTFDEVHASENLLRKVKDMRKDNVKAIKRISKKVVLSAAALAAVCFVSTNAIAYAATGSTWVDKIKVTIDGRSYDLSVQKEDNGDMRLEVGYDDDEENMNGTHFEATDDLSDPENGNYSIVDYKTGISISVEQDRVYLIYTESGEKVDITDNFVDGKCEGYIYLGAEKGEGRYIVTEENGQYSVDINRE